MWDAAESRFVDIPSKLKEPPSGRPVCQACKLRDERKVIEENEVVPYDKTHISLRNLHYHQHDFVYIAAESQRPYLIGQVDRFIIPKNPQSPDDCEVRVKILGRYDDIAETLYGAEVGKDEASRVCLPKIIFSDRRSSPASSLPYRRNEDLSSPPSGREMFHP